jgi:hypothetical protein
MSRIDPKRTGELCAILARRFPDAFPHILAGAVVKAQRAGLSAKAAETYAANTGHASEEAADKFLAAMRRKAGRITAALAQACAGSQDNPPVAGVLMVSLGGDPRGPCGWLRIRGADGEWMRGDGWDSDAGFPLH